MKKKKYAKLLLLSLVVLGISASAYSQGSQNVTLLGTQNNYASVGYNDIWGYTAPNGREYALLGVRNGTSIIDITNGSNPVEIKFFSSASSTWKDLKTYQSYAYVVNESGGGMQIIDLSELPNTATLAATYTGFTTSHNLYIDEANAMLYAEGGQAVRALSLADPVNPVQVSTFGTECHDIYTRNNLAYISEGNRRSIGVYNLSTPASPTLVGRFQIPNSGYVHNAWLSDDGNYLSTTEETTGKTVKHWDISDLNNVRRTDQYLGASRLAHNTHLMGNHAYISHYADGLKILDTSDPNNIFEVGHYDTSPSSGGFAGAWGAFPFFPSGKVLISDQASGLWIFDYDENADTDISLTMTPDAFPVVIPPGGGSFDYTITVTNNTDMSKTVAIWTYAYRDGGGSTDDLAVINSVQFDPGQTKTFNRTQIVPNIDAGNFSYYAKAGTYRNTPVAGDGFSFQALRPNRRRHHKAIHADISKWNTLVSNEEVLQYEDYTVPGDISLEPSYPNPFNPSTTINYSLDAAAKVNVSIYNVQGQKIKTLVNTFQSAGSQSLSWNATSDAGNVVAAGVYILRLEAGGVIKTQKLTLVK